MHPGEYILDDGEIEEVRAVLSTQPRSPFVLRQRLVDGEVHLSAPFRYATLDLPTGIAEWGEVLVLRLVHEDVAVSQKQDSWLAETTTSIPTRRPQLPANLKGDDCFSGPCCKREKVPAFSLQHRLDGTVDCDFLAVTWRLSSLRVVRRQKPFRLVLGQKHRAPPIVSKVRLALGTPLFRILRRW